MEPITLSWMGALTLAGAAAHSLKGLFPKLLTTVIKLSKPK